MIYNLKRQKEDERDFLFAAKKKPVAVLPTSTDLRSLCPAVFDQGQLGSCSANAGCANLMMLLKQPTDVLSRLYMYYQERVIEGSVSEDSGAQMRDICKVAAVGVCEEQYFPYDITKFTVAPTAQAVADAPKHKAAAYHAITSLTDIKHALAVDNSPVLMGMEVFESFEGQAIASTGVMPMPKAGEQNLGGHAVLIVGYDDKKSCLIVRNSWGADWGDKGYFYMPYQYVTKGLAYDFWELS